MSVNWAGHQQPYRQTEQDRQREADLTKREKEAKALEDKYSLKPEDIKFESQLGEDGLLKDVYQAQGGPAVSADRRGIDAIRDRALSEDPSKWAQMADEQQRREQTGTLNRARGQQRASLTEAMDAQAARGGMSGGAAERAALQSSISGALGAQDILSQGAQERGRIGMEDERQKLGLLQQLPGMDIAMADSQRRERDYSTGLEKYNIEKALGEMDKGRLFDVEKYKQDMTSWGAEKTAQATEKAAECFDADTEVRLADGSFKPITMINIGDQLCFGGEVLGTMTFKFPDTDTMYKYNDVLVSSEHAVFEDGKWVRVENSKKAEKTEHTPKYVYNLTTENHVVVCGDTVFSDYKELTEDISKDQFLEEMNRRDAAV